MSISHDKVVSRKRAIYRSIFLSIPVWRLQLPLPRKRTATLLTMPVLTGRTDSQTSQVSTWSLARWTQSCLQTESNVGLKSLLH